VECTAGALWCTNAPNSPGFGLGDVQGLPFMTALRDHKLLARGLAITYGVMFFAALELSTDFNEMLELAPMPTASVRALRLVVCGTCVSHRCHRCVVRWQMKWHVVALMAVDTVLVWVWELLVRKLLG